MTRKAKRFMPLTHNIPRGSLSSPSHSLVSHITHCEQGHKFIKKKKNVLKVNANAYPDLEKFYN